MKHSTLSLLLLMLVLSSCKRDDRNDGLDTPYIHGYVVEDPGGAAVPFAFVTVGKENSDNWVSTYELTDTLRADENGHFQLDRDRYKDLFNECVCTFVACGTGPDTPEGAEFYENHCYHSSFDPLTTDKFWCTAVTQGYVKIFVEDIPPYNLEYESVSCHILYQSFQSGHAVYPNPDFDLNEGADFGPYRHSLELTAKLVFIGNDGFINELEQV